MTEAAEDQGWQDDPRPRRRADREQLKGHGVHEHRDGLPCPVRLCPYNTNRNTK